MTENIEYRAEFSISDFVDKYVERISREIDQQTLDKVARQLAEYGYVKVVRCRDCVNCYFDFSLWMCGEFGFCVGDEDDGEPDGFCAWGERKEVDE